MMAAMTAYRNILVAIDFSSESAAALKLAVWLASKNRGRVVLAHSLRDLRRLLKSSPPLELVYGDADRFQQELRREADQKLNSMALELGARDVDISIETLLGDPYIELTHAVQAEGYDLVLAGTRGLASWKEFVVGSTARRLIRKCPSPVWVVKEERAEPPKVVLAGTDFSEVSLKAATQGLYVAQQADAEFHLLHVIDSQDVSEELIAKVPRADDLRQEINAETAKRLDNFLELLGCKRGRIQVHLSWGEPWKEVCRIAENVHADLIAMGTVGRSGIKGLLLGNTAEKVLSVCPCSMLTVKPDGFVSPIAAPFWQLHPAIAEPESSTGREAERTASVNVRSETE
jgi:nucleotide-binding universal stress UspA family protein